MTLLAKVFCVTEVSLPVQEPRVISADGTQLPRVVSAPTPETAREGVTQDLAHE